MGSCSPFNHVRVLYTVYKYNVCMGIYIHNGDGFCSGVSRLGLVVSIYICIYVQINCTRTYMDVVLSIDYIWSLISKVWYIIGSMCIAVLIG